MGSNNHRTLCQICHNNCGLIVSDNGTTLSVKGDPEHPVNCGYCCSKAQANSEIQRSPDRLRSPLKKSSSGFEKVSWEEALDFAAERLSEIRSKYGPQSLARCTGAPVSYQARDGFVEFMGAYGSPNMTSVGNLCMAPRMMAFNSVFGEKRAEPDYDHTKLVIFWGSNPLSINRYGSYAAYNGLHKIFPRLKERGVYTICIDPFRSQTAKKADKWIVIKPGGDNALGLAMINVIINEELFDHDFVLSHTFGFEELKKHIQPFDPEWAEEYTGINAKQIRWIARTYASVRPAAIFEGNGLDMYTNGVDAVRTIAILIGLCGNFDQPGGNVILPFPHPPELPTRPAQRKDRIGYDRFPAPLHVPFPLIKESLLRRDADSPRAMIVHHGNPVLTQANSRRTREALGKLDFLMVLDIFPTATTEMADLVLPTTSHFESYGYRAYSSVDGGIIAMARPVAKTQGEARSVFEIEYELAKRMGLDQSFPYRDERSWIDFMIKPYGVSFEELESEQIKMVTPAVRYQKYTESGFKTPSGKCELFSNYFYQKGISPLPAYNLPAGESLAPGQVGGNKFSLLGTSRRPSSFVHTRFKNLDRITKSYPEPLVYIHPEDAWGRDIVDGLVVEVNSANGTICLKARISEDTQPGLLWIDFGWGNPTDQKANINDLVDDSCLDPISGGTPNRLFACEVRRSQN